MRRRAQRRLYRVLRVAGQILSLGLWKGERGDTARRVGEVTNAAADAIDPDKARDDYGTPPDVPRGDR